MKLGCSALCGYTSPMRWPYQAFFVCSMLAGASLLCPAQQSISPSKQKQPLKVLISADMEGIADVTNWKIDSQPAGRDYGEMRKQMTAEVNAAATAAFGAGATEVTVADSHGDFDNIDPELLDQRCLLVRGWPRPLGMMQGLTPDTGAVILIGYHAPEGVPDAILAHTFTGSMVLRLNGKAVSEAAFNAAVAAELGVPIVFLSGDDKAVADATANIGPIETVITKKALSFNAGTMTAPSTVTQEIHDGVARALNRRRDSRPVATALPATLEWRFNNVTQAEMVSYLPGATRIDGNTVKFTVANMAEGSKLLTAVDLISAVSHE
jgi:D-amino peptidase